MFNGIIYYTGTVKSIEKKNKNCTLTIYSKIKFKKNEIGSSISCSGACLTLESFKKNYIKFYLSSETIDKTNFKYCKKNDLINIEKSLVFGDRISGHFAQGHIDTISKVKSIVKVGKSWVISFLLPKKFIKFLVFKGSITINGVSLTVSKIINNGFQVVIIPQTLKLTNLIHIKKKDVVNLEFDVLGKYINSFLK